MQIDKVMISLARWILVLAWLFGTWQAAQTRDPATGLIAALFPPYAAYVAFDSIVHPAQVLTAPAAGDTELKIEYLSQACLAEAPNPLTESMSEIQREEFCLCYSRGVFERILADAMRQPQAGEESAELATAVQQLRHSCASTARYFQESIAPPGAMAP